MKIFTTDKRIMDRLTERDMYIERNRDPEKGRYRERYVDREK